MKAAVMHAYDETMRQPEWVVYEDVRDPVIEKSHDVIVRIGGAGVCRTDLHIIEGKWRERTGVPPHIPGHENAGWVEAVGREVETVQVGDAVICHPLITNGFELASRRGNDMHAEDSIFPGMHTDGGYAELFKTTERALIKLPAGLQPRDVAPHADAGLAAYRAAKKASRHLLPGQYAAIIGAGGLGHIGIQVLRALCAAETIVVDRLETALILAQEVGADHVVPADGREVEAVLALTDGKGAEAVIDFAGESGSVEKALAMTRRDGVYYAVAEGGRVEIDTQELITTEKTIVGCKVGTYPELVELLALAQHGLVKATVNEYPLREANTALHDLAAGRVKGRAVLVP